MYIGVHVDSDVVTSLTPRNVLEYSSEVTRDAPLLLFWLWRYCKVYWNANVPNLRAQQKMMLSQISYEIFIVNRYKLLIHRVHKKFHLHCIRLKYRREWWDNGQIQIFAAQWLMGHFCARICPIVHLILKKIHTGLQQHGTTVIDTLRGSHYGRNTHFRRMCSSVLISILNMFKWNLKNYMTTSVFLKK